MTASVKNWDGRFGASERPRFSAANDFDLSSFGNLFDFVLAESVFSHTYGELTSHALGSVERSLAPGGVLVATFFETSDDAPAAGLDGSGWEYPDVVSYTSNDSGTSRAPRRFTACTSPRPHPRQAWVLAGRSTESLNDLAARLPKFGEGT